MKSAGKARNNGLYRHIRTSKEIIRNLLNDYIDNSKNKSDHRHNTEHGRRGLKHQLAKQRIPLLLRGAGA